MKFLKTFESFDSEMTAEEVYEILKRDCPEYLDLLRNCTIDDGELYDLNDEIESRTYYEREIPMLYRGTRAKTDDILSIEPRELRRAKDTNQKISDEIDDKFESVYNIRPRQSGVFTTPVRDVASHYGNSYLFFPIGDFDYIWSNEIDDLFDDLRNPPNKLYSWYLWETDSNYRGILL